MKKLNFLIALGLISAASMQAQTTVVSLGFEAGDQKYTTEEAYTPGGTYGDWVNRNEADEWTEPYAGDNHSGEYSFRMYNTEDLEGNTWDRGFKVGNLQLEDNTAYRVSFWVKADPSHFNAETGVETANKIKSSIAIGKEYFDMPISTKSGDQYYYTWANCNGEWKHYSYVTYFTNKADQDALSGSYSGKTDMNGNKVSEEGDPFPEAYFITINMYNPGEYILDDIKLEKGVTFNEATFNSDVIKLDFGYPTNIAALANANNGTLSLDPSQVTVKINGSAADVEFLEGKSDGFLYIFLNGQTAEDADEVTVSFTPAADCPIIYNANRRPSADVESEMKVLGFADETAYFDESIDAMPAAWSPAVMVSSVPENESFELDPATTKTISVTFDKKVALDYASATLTAPGVNKDLTSGMSLSDDQLTIITQLPTLTDGEYEFKLSGVTNSYGVDCLDDQTIIFAVGPDNDTSTSEAVYQSDFNNDMTGGIPPGWITYNEAGFHLYGFNDPETRTSQFNYNWGGTPGGGGARLYDGFSGDFIKAMYWGTRGTNEGYASYGEQVKDWILDDGSLDPDMPDNISLYLTPQKYQIYFQMAAWKGEPQFSFTLEDLDGNVYAKFTDYVAKPNMNGATGKVSGTVTCQADFTVDKEGYYVLKFTSAEAQWQEFLLANVRLITMPSKAAYYRQLLKAATEEAEAVLASAEDSSYDGDTKTALSNAIDNAKNGHFTSASEVNAVMDNLKELSDAMTKRMENIDNFDVAMLEAIAAYDELDGKYLNAEVAKTAKTIIDQYGSTNASALSDDELNEVTPAIMKAAAQMKNVKSVVDVLAWGAFKAAQTATLLGEDGTAGYEAVTDDRNVVKKLNNVSTQALYNKIAAGEDLTPYMTSVYYETGDQLEEIPEDNNGEYNEDGFPRAIYGIDFTGLIYNPHMYTFMTASAALQDNSIPGWMVVQPKDPGSLHFNGDPASEEKPVSDVTVNGYRADEYDFYQVVKNVPVGYYDIFLRTRTAVGKTGVSQDGTPDKYMYVQVGDGERILAPFPEGGSWAGYPTVIKNVLVTDGEIRIGAVENALSLKEASVDPETGEAIEGAETTWDTNTFVDDARIFFVAPADGVDYSKLKVAEKGDVNGDGVVNISDVVAIINTMAGDTTFKDTADVNGDGAVNISDVVNVINIMADTAE
jgi:methionine-rich copper-binding protein CopC